MNPYNINFCSKEIIADHEYVSDALCRYDGNHTAKTVRVLEFLEQEDMLYLQLKSKKIRLHILGIPHTVTNTQYSHCAFTGKVQRFAPMMRPLDYEVYHYGNAGSESGATKDICILSAGELESLSIESYKYLHPTDTDAQVKEALNDSRRIVGDLARWDTPLYKEFNRRLHNELKKYYRSTATDVVCNPYGRSYTEALNGLDIVKVECGIGYKDPCEAWRIYESYAWFHSSMALEGHNGTYKNYWYVIPQSFNVLEWPLNLNPTPKTVGFLGRIGPGKGCHLIVDIARRFPDVQFILCGGGDPAPYLQLQNIKFKQQIHGSERATYLGSLVALIAPTQYVEPYGCISPEAQLCGTPVIAPDSGGFTETVIHMKTGLLCHTLADYCLGIQLALDGQFDRSYIREKAVERFDMTIIAHKWDQAFKSILDMTNGAGGWYGGKSHIYTTKEDLTHTEILDALDYEELSTSINFNSFEKKIYSQNGEDGITIKLLELVYNDPYNKYYVEFGAENGKECNTRILMENYGWKGLLMDGTNWNHLINLQKEFITKENIVELFKKYSVPKKINLLSVDIDYNDFYVLHSILKEYVCDIIICEYNSTHLADEDKIIIYSATSGWDGTNYFGASLYSLQKLGELYNYSLVCCDSRGVNCFFIHNDIVKNKNIRIDTIEKIYRKAEYGSGPNGGHRQDMQYRKYVSFHEAIQ